MGARQNLAPYVRILVAKNPSPEHEKAKLLNQNPY
jgi:hypothetical protein